MRAYGERVWLAKELVIDQPAAVAVAKLRAVAPVGRDVDALPGDVRVADADEANRRRSMADRAAEEQRDFVRRPDVERYRAVRVGIDEDGRSGDEGLRAENTLRLAASELVAHIADAEQQKPANELRLRRLVDRGDDRAEQRNLPQDGSGWRRRPDRHIGDALAFAANGRRLLCSSDADGQCAQCWCAESPAGDDDYFPIRRFNSSRRRAASASRSALSRARLMESISSRMPALSG